MRENLFVWAALTLFLFFCGWLSVAFITLDPSIPLVSVWSRIWFAACGLISFVAMANTK